MTEKYTKDVENVRQANAKQMQAQESRLQNMADANLQKIRNDNAQQMKQVRATLQQRERELQQHNAWVQAERLRKEEEARRLRQQQEEAARRRNRKRGGKTAGILSSHFLCRAAYYCMS